MKKKNKGFTLIELLAVIVILGIILTIVVSNVVKYIGKAREGAFKDTYAKVLKDVSNKIALNDLGDTEEVACGNFTKCAAAYDVPEENISLLVTKLNDDKYSVSMKGIGSYSSIALTLTSKPNNAGLIDGQTISSTIDSDGEVKENGANNSKFFDILTENGSSVKEAGLLETFSYIKYDNNIKLIGRKKDDNVTISFSDDEKLNSFINELKEFDDFFISNSNYQLSTPKTGCNNHCSVVKSSNTIYFSYRPSNNISFEKEISCHDDKSGYICKLKNDNKNSGYYMIQINKTN